MREIFLGNWRVLAATLFSTVLIISTFVLVREVKSPPLAQASEETALLKAIATKDSDNDGLPDWEEALYGADPHASDTFHLGMTDGEAVSRGLIVPKAIADTAVTTPSTGNSTIVDPSLPPAPAEGTLTAAFAKNFFTLFVAAKQANGGADLSEEQMNDVANQTLGTLSSAVRPAADFKSMNDLSMGTSGSDALRAFAAQAEAVLLKNTSDATTTDLAYLKSAVINDDENAYGHIASLSKGYRGGAAGLAALPVPPELAAADLSLINTLMRMSEIDADFARASSDPLAAILALQQYGEVTMALQKAFVDIGAVYASAHLSFSSGTPGALFVNMIANTKQRAGGVTRP